MPTTTDPPLLDCAASQNWNHTTCQRKRRKWWGFVATILLIVVFCWAIVISYLLIQPAQSLVNRQVLLKDPYGQTQLYVVQQGADGEQPKIVAKQYVVSLYDLENRKQQSESITLLPTISQPKHYYIISYQHENQTFYRNVLNVKEQALTRSNHYASSWYFFQEIFYWLFHKKDKDHSHWVSEL